MSVNKRLLTSSQVSNWFGQNSTSSIPIPSKAYTNLMSAYDSIATTTVGAGGASSITFSSIPSTYKHLQIRGIARDNFAGGNHSVLITINSDTGSNYTYHSLYGDGSSALASALTSQTTGYPGSLNGTTVNSNTFAANILDILDYANTNKYKTIRSLSGSDMNGSGFAFLISTLWMSTSAISSITLNPAAGGYNFTQYTQFALYGIK